jgi:hypothetical protein
VNAAFSPWKEKDKAKENKGNDVKKIGEFFKNVEGNQKNDDEKGERNQKPDYL